MTTDHSSRSSRRGGRKASSLALDRIGALRSESRRKGKKKKIRIREKEKSKKEGRKSSN